MHPIVWTTSGIYFNSKGTFTDTKKHLTEQASKAVISLLRKWRQLGIPIDLTLDLFDKSVKPILLYGCEVWGHENVNLIKRIYLKFCKILLCVKINRKLLSLWRTWAIPTKCVHLYKINQILDQNCISRKSQQDFTYFIPNSTLSVL